MSLSMSWLSFYLAGRPAITLPIMISLGCALLYQLLG
jgi:hypothetical protein